MNRVISLGEDRGDFVVVLVYTFDDGDKVSSVRWRLVRRESPTLFEQADSGGRDFTMELDKAETTAEGFCKWDGCAEFGFDGNNAHVCGPAMLGKLLDAIERVYVECAILMGSDVLEECAKEGWDL